MGNLTRERLKSDNDKLFGFYQDWVHQNPGTHLDGGIEQDSKWKKRQNKLIYVLTQRYGAPYGRVGTMYDGIILVELHIVWNHRWNVERVINVQTVIL